jgi:hypothetical protein
LGKVFERPASLLVARRLLPPLPASEAQQRVSSRVIGRHAEPFVPLGVHVEMEVDLFVQTLLECTAAQEPNDAQRGPAEARP